MTRAQMKLLDRLFSEIGIELKQFIYRFTGYSGMAEDIVQQTFFLACLKIDVLCGHPNPRAWLFVTARHLIMREMEVMKYRANDGTDKLEDILMAAPPKGTIAKSLPEGLDQDEKDLLVEYLEYGYTLREMAEKRGISYDACRHKYSRTKKKCRQLMLKEKKELDKIK